MMYNAVVSLILLSLCISPATYMDDLEFEFRAERQYLLASGKTNQEMTVILNKKCKDKRCMVTVCSNCMEILKIVKNYCPQLSHGLCPDCCAKLYPTLKFWKDNPEYKKINEELNQKNITLKSL